MLPYSATGQLLVKRKPDNGGDVSFTAPGPLREAYASGALHPGDLKPAVRDAVDEVLQRVRAAIASDPELQKADKEVTKVLKRNAKGKK